MANYKSDFTLLTRFMVMQNKCSLYDASELFFRHGRFLPVKQSAIDLS